MLSSKKIKKIFTQSQKNPCVLLHLWYLKSMKNKNETVKETSQEMEAKRIERSQKIWANRRQRWAAYKAGRRAYDALQK